MDNEKNDLNTKVQVVSKNGQITLPSWVRDLVGLEKGGYVCISNFSISDQTVTIKKTTKE